MATENETVVETAVSDDTQQDQAEPNVSDVEAKIAELTAQLAKQNEIVEKARKGEKYQKSKADADVKKVLAQYEAEKARADGLELKIRNTAIDGVLRQALSDSGAKAVDTALKLVDRNAVKFGADGSVDVQSIAAVVKALKTSDSILFDQTSKPASQAQAKPPAPPAARSSEGDKVTGYAAEIKAAKTGAEIQAVLKKYGKA
jgi:hypothetical protein